MKKDYRACRVLVLTSIILHATSAFFIGMGLCEIFSQRYKHLGLYLIALIVFIATGVIDRECSKFLNERN